MVVVSIVPPDILSPLIWSLARVRVPAETSRFPIVTVPSAAMLILDAGVPAPEPLVPTGAVLKSSMPPAPVPLPAPALIVRLFPSASVPTTVSTEIVAFTEPFR